MNQRGEICKLENCLITQKICLSAKNCLTEKFYEKNDFPQYLFITMHFLAYRFAQLDNKLCQSWAFLILQLKLKSLKFSQLQIIINLPKNSNRAKGKSMDSNQQIKSAGKQSGHQSDDRKRPRPSLFPLRNSAKRKGSLSENINLFDPHCPNNEEPNSRVNSTIDQSNPQFRQTRSQQQFHYQTPSIQSQISAHQFYSNETRSSVSETPKQSSRSSMNSNKVADYIFDTPFVPFVHQSLTKSVWESEDVIPEERDQLQRKQSQFQSQGVTKIAQVDQNENRKQEKYEIKMSASSKYQNNNTNINNEHYNYNYNTQELPSNQTELISSNGSKRSKNISNNNNNNNNNNNEFCSQNYSLEPGPEYIKQEEYHIVLNTEQKIEKILHPQVTVSISIQPSKLQKCQYQYQYQDHTVYNAKDEANQDNKIQSYSYVNETHSITTENQDHKYQPIPLKQQSVVQQIPQMQYENENEKQNQKIEQANNSHTGILHDSQLFQPSSEPITSPQLVPIIETIIQHDVLVSHAPRYMEQAQQTQKIRRQIALSQGIHYSIPKNKRIPKLGFSYIDSISVRSVVKSINSAQTVPKVFSSNQTCYVNIAANQKKQQYSQIENRPLYICDQKQYQIESVKKKNCGSQISYTQRLKLIKKSYNQKIQSPFLKISAGYQASPNKASIAQQTQAQPQKFKTFKIRQQMNFSITHNYNERIDDRLSQIQHFIKDMMETKQHQKSLAKNRRSIDAWANTDNPTAQAQAQDKSVTPKSKNRNSNVSNGSNNISIRNFGCQYDVKDVGIRPSLKRVCIADTKIVYDIDESNNSTQTFQHKQEKKNSKNRNSRGKKNEKKVQIKLEERSEQDEEQDEILKMKQKKQVEQKLQDSQQDYKPVQQKQKQRSNKKSKRKSSKTPRKKKSKI